MCNSVWCNKEKDVNTHYRTPARYNRCSLKQQRIKFMCHGQIKWILSSTKSTKNKKKKIIQQKDIEIKATYNSGYNILELSDIVKKVWFTTS